MIFARGVRFIRAKSASVRGCASGSASAAFSTSSLDIGRSIFFEILILLTFSRSPRRNDSNSIVTLCVSYRQQGMPLRHPNDDEAVLAVVCSIVQTFDGKHIVKYRFRQFKAHSMSPEIRLRLGGIPFKLQFNNTTGFPYSATSAFSAPASNSSSGSACAGS